MPAASAVAPIPTPGPPPIIGLGADVDIGVIPDAIIKPIYDFNDIQSKLRNAPDDTETCKLLLGLHNRFWHAPVVDLENSMRVLGLWSKHIKMLIQ